MELENVLKLINAVSESSLTSFCMEDGDTKLSLGADRNIVKVEDIRTGTREMDLRASDIISDTGSIHNKSDDDSTNTAEQGLTINSPLVGVFYSAPSPDDKAYVAVGDRVKKGQVIGIVEAMKLMNEIESDYDGIVTDILVDNEQMVEYGQPMFVINPA